MDAIKFNPLDDLKPIHAQLCDWLDLRNDEYRDGQPTVTDFEFDMAFKALEFLEKAYPSLTNPDSPTQNVG